MTERQSGRLEGKRAVITGAAQGIGRGIAEAFVAEGAELLLVDIDAAKLDATATALGQKSITADVSRKAEIERIFARVEARWGGLDILVNNAGVTHPAELDDLTEEDFDRVFAINLKSALWATQSAARLMGEGAAIVNMSSVNAVLAIPNQIPYAISKGAMKQLTNVTALALAPKGIRVNAIGPGSIMTDMLRGIMNDKAAEDRIMSRTPLGRCGEVGEVAAVAVFLASGESSYITGQTIYPDGGRLGLNYTVPIRP
jgi:NAD(P)-dependent dehydrogenase (short-subunit alcohol dehydrogenase family)